MKKLIIILAAVISVSAASAQGYYNNRSHGITQEKAYRQRPDDTKQWNGNDRHAVAGNQSLYQKDIRPFNDNYRRWIRSTMIMTEIIMDNVTTHLQAAMIPGTMITERLARLEKY